MRFHKKAAAVMAASALAVILAGTSFAKSSTTPWIGLASVDGTNAATVQPKLGDTVTFNTVMPSTVKNPRIEVDCYQNGQMTFGEGGATTDFFTLGAGSVWGSNGGAANCTATLFYFGFHAGQQTYNWLASTNFSAGG
jgi:hypothetical protein